jgi:glycosyltransferase involved in cell wall biosynthesis
MRILIDMQGAQNGSRERGIGRFTGSFARAMIENAREHEIFLLLNSRFPDEAAELIGLFEGLLSPENIVIFESAGATAEVDGVVKPSNLWRLAASELLMEKFLVDLDVDAVVICSLFEGAQDDTIVSLLNLYRRHVTAVVLHDLIPLMDPDKYIGWQPARDWYFRKIQSLVRADLLLAVSGSARQEAIDYAHVDPARVVNMGSAVSETFVRTNRSRQEVQALFDRHAINKPYLMHTSAFEERKNFEGLIRSFAALPEKVRSKYQLVLVCKINDTQRVAVDELLGSEGIAPGEVILTGFVSDEDLGIIYENCHLFVFPSFHEGFGLPVLEAMQYGIPVIGSNRSSIPEVIGRQDALFDPASLTDMTRLMEKTLTDSGFFASLKQHSAEQVAKFTWDKVASNAIEALEREFHASRLHRDNSRAAEQGAHRQDVGAIAELIGRIDAPTAPTNEDVRLVATALIRNERTAALIRNRARQGQGKKWRIEGPFDSSYSLALVNRETARGLAALGHCPILHSTEGPGDIDASPIFLARNPDLARMHERERTYLPERTDVTSRNLFPPRVTDMGAPVAALHNYGWEETGFPADWVSAFNSNLTMITVVSEHVRKVLIDNGVHVPIFVTGAGVDHWDDVVANHAFHVEARSFRFLHVSSCFPRKGVKALLKAYGQAFSIADDVSLVIKTFDNPHNEVHRLLAECQEGNAAYPHVVILYDDLSDEDLKGLYEQCDVMVAPSCAEGFGLPFAEAMLSGIPVIATDWSGQLDLCNEANSWLVDFSFGKARTHFELWSSVWAHVDVDALAEAMGRAFASPLSVRRAMAEIGREQLLAEHRWTDVAARLLDALATVEKLGARRDEPRIGWVSTWNAQCGISTYSEHLVRHIPGAVTIFAAQEADRTRPDEGFCIRSWTSSKSSNGLSNVLRYVRERHLDTIVIQFNYAFFNHQELAEFIRELDSLGCSIIMMMHSTKDPVVEIPGSELYRIADSLALCDRILVHSVTDLNRLKAIGLIDNVALFPHGLLSRRKTPAARPHEDVPVIATYGFCLPHKGLLETVEAVVLLRDRGTPVRLKMINARFPARVSDDLIAELDALIEERELRDLVECCHDFLEDDETIRRLQDATLIVFPYQETGESASGAVRYGLAAQRPVAVTPLSIFEDLEGAVHCFPGQTPEAIADGIVEAMREILTKSPLAREIAANAASWRAQHDYTVLGPRMLNIAKALRWDRRKPELRYLATNAQFSSSVGKLAGSALVSSGEAGILLDGPEAHLKVGRYCAMLHGEALHGDSTPLDVTVVDERGVPLAPTQSWDMAGPLNLPFSVFVGSSAVSLRVMAPAGANVRLAEVSICPLN